MRLKNLTRSVNIILMLLAMMFSCQPVSEDVGSSNNGGSNSGNQNGGNAVDNDNENEGGKVDCNVKCNKRLHTAILNPSIF